MAEEAKFDADKDATPSLMTRETRGKMVSLLKANEYNDVDISEVIEDVSARLAWKPQSLCLVFSRKSQTWLNGQVSGTFIDDQTKKEWLSVKYGQKSKKQMQRFCADIKPIDASDEYQFNNDAVKIIVAELELMKVYSLEPDPSGDDMLCCL